jgi:hypothetical protein
MNSTLSHIGRIAWGALTLAIIILTTTHRLDSLAIFLVAGSWAIGQILGSAINSSIALIYKKDSTHPPTGA